MKKVFIAVFLSLVFSFVGFAEQLPTEESLITAWEEIQKMDPNTVTFEKINKSQYKFSNKKIPFDGILKINDATIDTDMMIGDNNYIMGIVDAELVGASDEFMMKNARRYYIWARNNNLYYDKKESKWISMQEFQKALTGKQEKMIGVFSFLSNYFIPIVLIAFIGFTIYLSKKQKKVFNTSLGQMNKSLEMGEKSLALNQETNEILKNILEELKKSK